MAPTLQYGAIQFHLLHKMSPSLIIGLYQDVRSVCCFYAGVAYSDSRRQYPSRVSFNLTTCSVVLTPHQAVTASRNCGPGLLF